MVDRRQLVVGAGVLALSSTLNLNSAFGQTRRKRRDVSLLAANDPFFGAYAHAVRLMHELPASDPRHWTNQSRIHLEHCPHQSPAFCHWHRHYVARFEAICAELVGDPAFTLPYWDWVADNGVIPAPFFDRAELNFSTFDAGADQQAGTQGKRALTKERGLRHDPRGGADFAPSKIYAMLVHSDYGKFRAALERPHGNVHVIIGRGGGHMTDMMSPLDPLFWLHHCNVDRLWAQWQAAGNRTPALDQSYAGQFYDAEGAPVSDATSANALDIANFGYTYDVLDDIEIAQRGPWSGPVDDDGSGLTESAFRVSIDRLGAATRGVSTLGGTASEFGIRARELERNLLDLNRSRPFWVPNAALEAPAIARRRPRIIATLKNVALHDEAPDVTARVFVNCPYLAPDTPSSAPHYAGSFSFFGVGHHGGGEFDVDLTDTLLSLAGQGQIDLAEINVQVIAAGEDLSAPANVTIGEVEIAAV